MPSKKQKMKIEEEFPLRTAWTVLLSAREALGEKIKKRILWSPNSTEDATDQLLAEFVEAVLVEGYAREAYEESDEWEDEE